MNDPQTFRFSAGTMKFLEDSLRSEHPWIPGGVFLNNPGLAEIVLQFLQSIDSAATPVANEHTYTKTRKWVWSFRPCYKHRPTTVLGQDDPYFWSGYGVWEWHAKRTEIAEALRLVTDCDCIAVAFCPRCDYHISGTDMTPLIGLQRRHQCPNTKRVERLLDFLDAAEDRAEQMGEEPPVLVGTGFVRATLHGTNEQPKEMGK